MTQAYAGGEIAWRPLGHMRLQGGAMYEDYSTGSPSGGARPPIESMFTPVTAPALGLDPAYWHGTASLGYDWRPSPGYARRGGLYQVRYHQYAGGVDDFERVEGEVVQHVPLVRENWVFSLRGYADSVLSEVSKAVQVGRTVYGRVDSARLDTLLTEARGGSTQP